MSLSFKKIVGALLLTAAVVGGTAVYLDSTLKAEPTTVALIGVASEKTADQPRRAEVTVTEGQAS